MSTSEREIREAEQREKDETLIDLITEQLTPGPMKQLDLAKECSPFTRKRVRSVLRRYRGRLWLENRLPEKHALEYRLIPQRAHTRA